MWESTSCQLFLACMARADEQGMEGFLWPNSLAPRGGPSTKSIGTFPLWKLWSSPALRRPSSGVQPNSSLWKSSGHPGSEGSPCFKARLAAGLWRKTSKPRTPHKAKGAGSSAPAPVNCLGLDRTQARARQNRRPARIPTAPSTTNTPTPGSGTTTRKLSTVKSVGATPVWL